MTRTERAWVTAGLPAGAYEALTHELSASRLWSLLLDVAEARAAARRTASLIDQWERDAFVQPAYIDQRTQLDVDRQLLDAAAAFESVELSPVAPLGVCSIMGPTSQNKVLSALRGTEVVSDPTNVIALECARRLRADRAAVVRLTTSHRCLRAQPFPKIRGFASHFRMFCLASAAFERPNHAFTVDAIAEHITVMLDALARLERHGFAFPDRRIALLTTDERAELGDRIAARLDWPALARARLEHRYYDGIRFQISARSTDGQEVPVFDGGTFDWVAQLASNRHAVYVASGLGSQLLPLLFRGSRGE